MARVLLRYGFLFKKVLTALVTFLLAVVLIFLVLRMTPGDLVNKYALTLQSQRNIPYNDARTLAVSMLNYDPDEPVLQAFSRFVSGVFNGSFGQSIYADSITAGSIIRQRLPWTLFVASMALLISFLVGTWMGTRLARKRKGLFATVSQSYIVISNAIPDYLIGLLLMTVFAVRLGWFPISGNYSNQSAAEGLLPFIVSIMHHAFLPVVSMTLAQLGGWALMMRGSAIGVLGEDYINAAKARGLPAKTIMRNYMKKNAILPLITSLTLSFAAVFGGAPLLESIFNYPGLGSELNSRIIQRDFFVAQGILLFTSAIVIVVNLITDFVYSLVDPRVRREN